MTDSAAVSIESVSLSAEVSALAEHVRELQAHVEANADLARGSLLDELCTLNDAVRHLRDTRDAVLVQVRNRGVSWNSISTKTTVPATTWRGRHDRYLEGEQP